MTDCPICDRPAHAAIICRHCLTQLRHQLDTMPSLLADLEITATRQDRFQPPSDVHASPASPPLPFDPRAAQHLADTRRTLTAWASTAHQQATGQPLTLTPAEACKYLTATLHQHHADPWLADLATDIDRHTRRGRTIIDTPTVRARIHVGPCPADTDDGHCPGDIFAWIPTDPSLRPVLQCNTCNTQWLPETWARAGIRIHTEQQRRTAAQHLAQAITGGNR